MKSSDTYGYLANTTMRDMDLWIKGYPVSSSENVYQALKFPDDPDLQQRIMRCNSMESKKIAWLPENKNKIHPLWNKGLSFTAMRYTTAWKMSQNIFIVNILHKSKDKPIVELSYKDTFWGAKPQGKKAVGCNFLGRIFMEHRLQLREYMESDPDEIAWDVPKSDQLYLLGEPVDPVVLDNLLMIKKPKEKPSFMLDIKP